MNDIFENTETMKENEHPCFYTAESVMRGHPDKLCDLIADNVLDECLKHDPASRVACEVMATHGHIIVAGEITTSAKPDVFNIVRDTLRDVGYDPKDYQIDCYIHAQSPDIAGAVEPELVEGEDEDTLGAGDQGVMVGYACNETPEYLPMPVVAAQRLVTLLEISRMTGVIPDIGPDGKVQVTMEYNGDTPVRITTVVVSVQHKEDTDINKLADLLDEYTEWSAQSIQRILQNEKYCGDVLLQKTFTEDVLTGVHKKNTGQLPQYYIENYHEGIVSKQMFREVQTEIARRNSKSAANQRKRRRGRYNSKYALSERLVCGNCGSPYKRVTWNIHGRKQIVWRCVNRIEYGTKFCGSSPSVPEEELHRAILKAVQDLAANFTDEVAAQINGILHDIQTGESAKPNLQEQLEQTQQEFDRLLEMSLDFDEDTPFLDDRLKKLNSKIKRLRKAIGDTAAQQEKASQPEMLLSARTCKSKNMTMR